MWWQLGNCGVHLGKCGVHLGNCGVHLGKCGVHLGNCGVHLNKYDVKSTVLATGHTSNSQPIHKSMD